MKKKIYLCFDIGATTTKVACIDTTNLEIIKRNVFNTKKENELFDKDFLINSLLNEIDNTINEYKITAIGISTSGGVDMKTSTICHVNKVMEGYVGVCWKEIIETKYKIKTAVLNDIKAAGLAEFSKRNIKSGVMVTLGTGFGAAVFINKKLYSGSTYCAGEVGQMVWPFDNSITVDTACSAVVTTNKIKKIINDDSFKLTEHYKIEKSLQALKIKEDWMKNVAYILQVLNYFYDPQLFIVGGGVSKHKELINEIIKFLPKDFKKVEVAKDANDAAFYGLINYLNEKK